MLDIADSVRPIDRSATFQVFDLLILVNSLVIRICTLIVVKAEPTCGALAFAVCRPAGDDVICDIAAVAIILIVGVVARGGSERSEILVIESIIRTGSLIIQDGTALCRVPKVQLLIANGHKEESLRLYTEAQISHQSGRFVPFCVQKTMRVAE